MGGGSRTTTTTQSLSPEQQELFQAALPTYQNYIDNPPEIATQQVAGFNQNELNARQGLEGAVGGLERAYQQGQGIISGAQTGFGQSKGADWATRNHGQAVTGLADPRSFAGARPSSFAGPNPASYAGPSVFSYQGADPASYQGANPASYAGREVSEYTDPYIQQATQAVLNPLTDSLANVQLPGIRQGAIGAGSLGSSRQALSNDGAVNQYLDRAGNAVTGAIYNPMLQAATARDRQTQGLTAEQARQTQGLTAQQARQSQALEEQRYGRTQDLTAAQHRQSQSLDAHQDRQSQSLLNQGNLQTQNLQFQDVNRAEDRDLAQRNANLSAATSYLVNSPNIANTYSQLGANAALAGPTIQAGLGQQSRALEQAQSDAAYRANQANQFLPYQIARDGLTVGAGLPGGSTVAQTSGGGVNPLQAGLGLLSIFGGGGFGGLFGG